MICTFCGTENREANKFCGMCGVRLERRKGERRTQPDASLKCESCAYVNEPGYKFCGMCGTRIERRMAERRGVPGIQVRTENGHVAQAVADIAVAGRNTAEQHSAPGQPRVSAALSQSGGHGLAFRVDPAQNLHTERSERTGIQGPSFLGLSDEPEDDTAYLLEEENSSGSGLRRLVLLVILAAIIGLIFVQYRSSLRANPKPTQPSHAPPPGQSQPVPEPSATKDQSQAPGNSAPATAPIQTNSQSAATQEPTASGLPNGSDLSMQMAPAKTDGSPTHLLDPVNVADKSISDVAEVHENRQIPTATEDALNAPVPAEQKPSPTLLRAQQYLHGRGVSQNCEQGLLYLRAAAQKNEPAAAVQMGALYASGHCVQQDRVVAYRWFNSAHELQPANQWILRNMDLLWGQMTEQERRLAAY